MIQDIAPHILDNAFAIARTPRTGDWIVYIATNNNYHLQPAEALPVDTPTQYLITVDDQAFYSTPIPPPIGCEWLSIQDLRTAKPRHQAFGTATAIHLMRWYAIHRFCGHCGAPTQPADTERNLTCPTCNTTIYPTICPAVIVAITCGDAILLTCYANRHNKPALVAGFVEIGETLESCVHREVMEEVGLKLDHLTYYKSQPWGFTNTLLAGFYAEVSKTPDGNLPEPTIDTTELSEAVWVKRKDIPDDTINASLTWEMIITFRDNMSSL